MPRPVLFWCYFLSGERGELGTMIMMKFFVKYLRDIFQTTKNNLHWFHLINMETNMITIIKRDSTTKITTKEVRNKTYSCAAFSGSSRATCRAWATLKRGNKIILLPACVIGHVRYIIQYSNLDPKLSGQNCNFFKSSSVSQCPRDLNT